VWDVASYPLVAEMMMMRRMTATTTPMIPIIFMFCHQYFLLRRVACGQHLSRLGHIYSVI
jgi:hypothetical protein